MAEFDFYVFMSCACICLFSIGWVIVDKIISYFEEEKNK